MLIFSKLFYINLLGSAFTTLTFAFAGFLTTTFSHSIKI